MLPCKERRSGQSRWPAPLCPAEWPGLGRRSLCPVLASTDHTSPTREEGRSCERCRAVCIRLYIFFLWKKRERGSWLGCVWKCTDAKKIKKKTERKRRRVLKQIREWVYKIQSYVRKKCAYIVVRTQRVKEVLVSVWGEEWQRERDSEEKEFCFLGCDPALSQILENCVAWNCHRLVGSHKDPPQSWKSQVISKVQPSQFSFTSPYIPTSQTPTKLHPKSQHP